MGNFSEQNIQWFVRYRPGRTDERTRRPDSTIPPQNFLWGIICIWFVILIFNFNQFHQNLDKTFHQISWKYTSIHLALCEKISTKLKKIHTFPNRSSEFHTIHDLDNRKLNSILFQVFNTEYEPCNNLRSIQR